MLPNFCGIRITTGHIAVLQNLMTPANVRTLSQGLTEQAITQVPDWMALKLTVRSADWISVGVVLVGRSELFFQKWEGHGT